MAILVRISGAEDSGAGYAETEWLAADAEVQQAILRFYEAGATIDNVADAVKIGLEDAEAGES